MRPRRGHIDRTQPAEMIIHLDAMTYGGEAIGRVEGKAVFVQGGIAGEVVRVVLTDDRRRFARARTLEVIEASPQRVQPRCKHFGFDADSCGGCHWQHIEYAAQLQFKTEIVRGQFRRIGRIDDAPVREIVPSPDAWAYRNHAQFSVAPDGRPGFQAARSNTVVPIDECHVIQPPIADWLRASGRIDGDSERIEVRASEKEDLSVWRYGVHSTRPQSPPSIFRVKNATFRVSPDSFFQVNTSLIETLIDLVLSRLDPSGGKTVLDAYCGVGLFSRFIAPIADRVIGIESGAGAVADARENLSAFGNVDLREGFVEQVLPNIDIRIDAAVVDPPRSGCGTKVIRAIIDKKVKRLIYVSCDPSTLARDVRQLIDGGYELTDVQPLDMFPQTYHIECVAQFERAGDAPTAGSGYTQA